MTPAEFRALFLLERYAHPTPEWHPTAADLAAAADRVRLCEDALYLEQHDEATA